MDKIRKNKTAIFVFLFPSALLFLAIIILPIFMSGYYSLLDWDGITSGTFVGIQNYIELFTEKSLGFGPTVRNAFIFAGLSVFLQLPLALLLALTLAKGIKGERFFCGGVLHSGFVIHNRHRTIVDENIQSTIRYCQFLFACRRS